MKLFWAITWSMVALGLAYIHSVFCSVFVLFIVMDNYLPQNE